MKTHVQIVAVLHIAMGILSLLAAIGVFAFLAVAGGIVVSNGEREAAGIIGVIAIVLGSFLAVLSLPSIIGGWALFVGCTWARPLVLVLGALHILNVPFGTALGIYTFWALLSNQAAVPNGRPAVQSIA